MRRAIRPSMAMVLLAAGLSPWVDASAGDPASPAMALSLVKSVCNASTSPTGCTSLAEFGINNLAKPGEDIIYRVVYSNDSVGPLDTLKVIETTPLYTTFVSAEIESLPAGLSACQKTTPAGVADCSATQPVGGTGAVNWDFTGTLAAGQSSAVRLRVRVDAN